MVPEPKQRTPEALAGPAIAAPPAPTLSDKPLDQLVTFAPCRRNEGRKTRTPGERQSHPVQAGVDLLTISKLLGHADTRMTAKHYAHLADKTLALAVAKLPNFTAGRMRPQNLRAVR